MARKRSPVLFQPEALSVEDAAKFCSVGVDHMWDLVKDDKVDVRKDGRRTLILTDSLRRWLHSLPRR